MQTLTTRRAEVNWGDGSISLHPVVTSPFKPTHTYSDDDPTATLSDEYSVSVTIIDAAGESDNDSATVTVANVDPVIGSVTSTLTNSDLLVEVPFDDAGDDTHVVTFDWGDGTSDTVDPATTGASASHLFAQFGTYEVEITVTDDDTGSASTSFELIIGGGACDCTEGLGWWKHQYKGNGSTELTTAQIELLALMVGSQTGYFNGLTVEAAREVFDPTKSNNKGGEKNGSKSGRNDASATGSTRGKKKGSKANSKANSNANESDSNSESLYRLSKFEEKAAQHVLAAWLNFAKGAVDADQNFTVDGVDYTFTELRAEVESLMSGEPTKAELNQAKKLAEAVNSLDKGNDDCDSHSGSHSGSGSDSGTGTGSAGPKAKKGKK